MIKSIEGEILKCSQELLNADRERMIMINEAGRSINKYNTLEYVAKIGVLQDEVDKWQKIIDKMEIERDELLKENSILKNKKLIQDGILWLTDVIDIEKPEFGKVNLILSPVGSGKTTLIKEKLAKDAKNTVLLLVSTTNLKNSMAPSDNELREILANRAITTKNKKVFGEGEYEMLTMTYAQFGGEMVKGREFLEGIEYIFCDEIHSLPEYESFGKNRGLIIATDYLFHEQEGKTIFQFTATDENLINMKKQMPEIMNDVKTFDYRKYPGIKKYISLFTKKISDIEQIRDFIRSKDCNGDFLKYGYKGLVFSKTIASMKKIEEVLIEEGFNPLVLWSTNNTKHPMNDKQLKSLNELMLTNKIPKPYNFLIINGAMREGWDLKDEKVQLAIMNTVSETDQIQARGRIRNNIAQLIIRVPKENYVIDISNIKVPEEYLNVNLTTEDKSRLCIELNILDNNGRVSKWNKVKEILIEIGYVVNDRTITIDRKRARVSTITE